MYRTTWAWICVQERASYFNTFTSNFFDKLKVNRRDSTNSPLVISIWLSWTVQRRPRKSMALDVGAFWSGKKLLKAIIINISVISVSLSACALFENKGRVLTEIYLPGLKETALWVIFQMQTLETGTRAFSPFMNYLLTTLGRIVATCPIDSTAASRVHIELSVQIVFLFFFW